MSVTGGWAHLNQADCRRTARLIIDWNLHWKWRVGEIEAKRRFCELSKGESGRMAEETVSRADLTRFWNEARHERRPRIPNPGL